MNTTHGRHADGDHHSIAVDGNLVAVAARIQERAVQLLTEQARLKTTKKDFDNIILLSTETSQKNASEKRRLLDSTNARNQVEIELFDVRQRTSSYKKSIHTLNKKAERTKEATERTDCEWVADVENCYSPHILGQELYGKAFAAVLRTKDMELKKVRERIRVLKATSDDLRSDEEKISQDCLDLEDDMKSLTNREAERTEKVSTLAEEVRGILHKRAPLRQSLRVAQEESCTANQALIRWEQECVSSPLKSFVTGPDSGSFTRR